MIQIYFAYGSNLDRVAWSDFCARNNVPANSIRPVGKAYLPDERLVFDYRSQRHGGGVLNIRPQKGALVEGHLFEVADGWVALDKKEGHPKFYRRETVTVLDPYGSEIQAVTYRVTPEKRGDFVAPTEAYLESCRRGMERFEISTDQLELASENARAEVCQAIFCYGTLMRFDVRPGCWADQAVSYVSMAVAQGHLVSHGDYPGFVPASGSTDALILGEFLVFEHIAEALERFDAIEGFRGLDAKDNLFRRTLVTVDVGGGRPRQAWTYATCRPEAMPIASGDWREHCGRRTDVVRRILADRIAREPNFLMQLANVPDGPFGCLYERELTFDEVLADLLSGKIDERSLTFIANSKGATDPLPRNGTVQKRLNPTLLTAKSR